MKKPLLFLLFSAALASNAQPILNQNNAQPVIGSTISAVSGSFGGVDAIDVTGASVDWDFSSLMGSTNSIDIVTPSSTPFAGSVSGATVAIDYGSMFDYYNVSATAWERKASYITSNYYFNFTNAQSVVEYPCTYLTTFNDTYVLNANVTGDILDRNGTMNAIADGYGSLILPWGTIDNVLRIKIDETFSDIWNGTDQTSGSQTTYLFLHPGADYLLLSVNMGEFTAPTFTFMGESVVSVNEPIAADTRLHSYPNPANTTLNVPVSHEDENAQLSVYNSIGQCVYSQKIVSSNGSRIMLNTSEFESDIYTLQIVNGQTSRTENFVVTR